MRIFFRANRKPQMKTSQISMANLAVTSNNEVKQQPVPKPEKKIIAMKREDIEDLTTTEKHQIALLNKEKAKIEVSTYENTFLWSQPLPYEKERTLKKLSQKLIELRVRLLF